jgi:glyoxylase-like metal-dependent hydrolase (beta-lactamase superfamily II)
MDNIAQKVTGKHAHAVHTYGLQELKEYYRQQDVDELFILRDNWPWRGQKTQLALLGEVLDQRWDEDEEEEQAGRAETVLGGVRLGDVVPSPPEEEAQPDAATEEHMSGSIKNS